MDQSNRKSKTVVVTLSAGFGLGALCMAGVMSGRIPVATPALAAPQIGVSTPKLVAGGFEGIPELRSLDASFRILARVVGPTVVDIKAGHGGDGGQVALSQGEGSGFLISGDGWIVTNDHVVDGAKTVTVTMKDGRTYEGKVTPSNDDTSDVAMVKIEAKNLPFLAFADSGSVEPGEFAVAVGAPFGLENSVTIGHVSALGRRTNISGQGKARGYSDLIQTDAAINMGNSGGPLVNVDGQVIGMNTAIYSPTGGSNGIGFAIPSNQVRLISNLLMTKGKLTRSMIGVLPDTLKEYQRVGLLKDGGARVSRVSERSAAMAAGLKEGDVIVKIGDRKIRTEMDLRNATLVYPPNVAVDLQYVRDNALKTTKVTLKPYVAQTMEAAPMSQPRRRRGSGGDSNPFEQFRDFPDFNAPDPQSGDEGLLRTPEDEARTTGEPAHLGVSVADVDESVRSQYSLPKSASGVLILEVEPNSVAQTLGFRKGDLVVSVGDKSVTNGRELQEAMSSVKWGDRSKITTVRYRGSDRTETTHDVAFK